MTTLLSFIFYKIHGLRSLPYRDFSLQAPHASVSTLLKTLNRSKYTIKWYLLSCHKPFHPVDKSAALQLKSRTNAIKRQEQFLGDYVYKQQPLLFAFDVYVLIFLFTFGISLRFFHTFDKGRNGMVTSYLGRCTE